MFALTISTDCGFVLVGLGLTSWFGSDSLFPLFGLGQLGSPRLASPGLAWPGLASYAIVKWVAADVARAALSSIPYYWQRGEACGFHSVPRFRNAEVFSSLGDSARCRSRRSCCVLIVAVVGCCARASTMHVMTVCSGCGTGRSRVVMGLGEAKPGSKNILSTTLATDKSLHLLVCTLQVAAMHVHMDLRAYAAVAAAAAGLELHRHP